MRKLLAGFSIFTIIFGFGPVSAEEYAYAPAAGSKSEFCYWMFQDERGPQEIEGFNLTRETARPGLVELPEAPDGAAAINCIRSSPVPSLHDYETVLRGFPLFLRVPRGGDEITIVAIGVKDGQFYAGVPQGTITDAERERLVKRLDEFLDAYAELDTEK